jgi:hypothetical protein
MNDLAHDGFDTGASDLFEAIGDDRAPVVIGGQHV